MVASFFSGAFLTLTLVFIFFFTPPNSFTDSNTKSNSSKESEQSSSVRNQINQFSTIVTDLSKGYVDPIDTSKIFRIGMNAMLSQLDPYTEFEDVSGAADMRENISGKYGGVGIVIGRKGGDEGKSPPTTPTTSTSTSTSTSTPTTTTTTYNEVKVVNAIEGYAYNDGVRVGDTILSVDGINTNTLPMDEIRTLLRGDPNTKVVVKIERQQYKQRKELEFTLIRQRVSLRDVKVVSFLKKNGKVDNGEMRLNDEGEMEILSYAGYTGIGYIKLSGFSEDAGSEIRRSVDNLQQLYNRRLNFGNENRDVRILDGMKPLKGLIIDLRGNPGGLLTSAVDIASSLIPPGEEIVSARGRGFSSVTYKVSVQ